ncbi:single-stranded-DNA-specific exonuclease RecJ [Aureivirga sp. CE67]|uniref:single-stranded-DNA-specific exonuclease RecJ n=1 Tax=Aureivirga sp. CE67 TaxID=1788983 RepID=UPI0018CADCEA|nr:single-stranded-DNA-specific exonuclease RecJ [Aureivirga sp. CE67]
MRWTIKEEPNPEKIEQLSKEINVSNTLAKILVQRGIETFEQAKQFFRPSLEDLHSPFLMKDMEKAVNLIQEVISKNGNILVYGDYDVDGTTAVSLMSTYLKTLTPNVASYIPDRYTEGYGVSFQGIDFAIDNDFSLMITLDCGIKAMDKVKYAKENGVSVIICDHHRPGEIVPDADAILNPKQKDCHYPYDELSGCGVGFKLIQALNESYKQSFDEVYPYLDLVAVSIGADIVPMTGENRTLAHFGLKIINEQPRIGIKALKDVSNKKMTITDVVFGIAPKINAAGRIKHGLNAVKLLTETNEDDARIFAKEINYFNKQRKDLDKQITQEALLQIVKNEETSKMTTVVYDENWHKGVIGIVASRLIESYYRPTIVFTKSNGKLTASARSVRGFDVYEAIDQCSEFIEQFGGHKYAAGLTILEENYESFKNKFEQVVSETLPEELKTEEISIDAEIEFEEITPRFYAVLRQFAPFGPANMKPVFKCSHLKANIARKIGADANHLKLQIADFQKNLELQAVGFNLGEKLDIAENSEFSAAFQVDLNTWNGKQELQLILKDIKENSLEEI